MQRGERMDELFRLPFLTGLLLAVLLPVLGNLLRLRDEWLATLGLAHLAAAGGLLAVAVSWPVLAGALPGALLGVLGKAGRAGRSNSAYAVMILAGWSAASLLAANTSVGEALAHAVVDGQLYFAGTAELLASVLLVGIGWPALRWLTPRLIAGRLLPAQEKARAPRAWRWHLGFDLLVALAVAIATTSIGLMASFALLFIPAWLAFGWARNWRQTHALAVAISLLAYLLAFFIALHFDQPFGPCLSGVLVLLLLCSSKHKK